MNDTLQINTGEVKQYAGVSITRGLDTSKFDIRGMKIRMPCCGNMASVDLEDLTNENIPCPCGKEGHFVLRWVE